MSIALPSKSTVGRFAPSPTGPLHFGSLVAAVASFLEAKGGRWLLRIEDVDRTRALPTMDARQQLALKAYGFEWEPEVFYQSKREPLYQEALNQLIKVGLAYPCTCSRSSLSMHPAARLGKDGAYVYPGTCSGWQLGDAVPEGASWRFRVGKSADPVWQFKDRVQGVVQQQLAQEVGDFILRRSDGCTSYQLAVVVDDIAQQVTQVVRGADLLDSTPRQLALIKALGGQVPEYAHVPVVVNVQGEKLSKQTLAQALPENFEWERVASLFKALVFLGQNPPLSLLRNTQDELWSWAQDNWSMSQVPSNRTHSIDVV